jgi:O-antigen ligase
MLLGLQIYFIISSIILFLYAIKSYKTAAFAFSYALAINIIPIFWVPYYSMDVARIAGVPLAYLPIIAGGFALIIKSRFKIKREYTSLLFIMFLFVSYTFITTLIIHPFTIKNFSYWFAWPLNFLIFLGAITFFSNIGENLAQEVIKSTAGILVIGSGIGLFRYFSGINGDANFMPVVNRNGTVVFIVMIIPLLFYIYSNRIISQKKFILYLSIIFTTLLFIFSRSGIIGFIGGIILYYMKFSLRNLIKIFLIMGLFVGIFVSGIADKSLKRLERTITTVEMLSKGEEFDSSMGDYNRVMLIFSAIEIIKHNFWFGTGLGLENYRNAFHEVSSYHHDSKAHNFYLSYFAELGLVGFSILVLLFITIYKKLASLNSPYRAFRVSFWVIAIMMTMNEYILLPEIWFYFGMLAGISYNYKLKKLGGNAYAV